MRVFNGRGQTALFLTVLKITAILLKGGFFMFLWAKMYMMRFSAHCRVRIKKLVNIKLRNMSILAIKCTFLGQTRHNTKNGVHFSCMYLIY